MNETVNWPLLVLLMTAVSALLTCLWLHGEVTILKGKIKKLVADEEKTLNERRDLFRNGQMWLRELKHVCQKYGEPFRGPYTQQDYARDKALPPTLHERDEKIIRGLASHYGKKWAMQGGPIGSCTVVTPTLGRCVLAFGHKYGCKVVFRCKVRDPGDEKFQCELDEGHPGPHAGEKATWGDPERFKAPPACSKVYSLEGYPCDRPPGHDGDCGHLPLVLIDEPSGLPPEIVEKYAKDCPGEFINLGTGSLGYTRCGRLVANRWACRSPLNHADECDALYGLPRGTPVTYNKEFDCYVPWEAGTHVGPDVKGYEGVDPPMPFEADTMSHEDGPIDEGHDPWGPKSRMEP